MPEPTAVTIALEFQNQLAKGNADYSALMARRWLSVEKELEGIIEKLATDILAMKERGEIINDGKLRQLARYQQLLLQLDTQITSFIDNSTDELESELENTQGEAIQNAIETIAVQSGRGVASSLNRLGIAPSEKIAGLARAGQPLGEILNRAYPLAAEAITQKLITGTALGWNPRKTVQEIMRNGGLDTALNHLLLVARDQQIRNYREASRDVYQQSGVVYGYMRIAAKNDRTCMACLALDGTVWPTSKMMPLHPQDRCSMIPLVSGRDVPEFDKGLDYFRSLSPKQQKERLGEVKYNMWQKGEFELSQIVSFRENETWGTSTRITTVKDLIKGRGGLPKNQTYSPQDLQALFNASRNR